MANPSPQNKRKKISREEEKEPDIPSSLAKACQASVAPSERTLNKEAVQQQVVDALVQAAGLYKEQDQKAYSKGEYYDDLVEVKLPGGPWLPIDQLGNACSIAKRTVGKLKVVAFPQTGEVFVHQVASGHTHGAAVGHVVTRFGIAAEAFSDMTPEFVNIVTDGMFGSESINAPDLTVQSLGQANGEPTGDSEFGPIFFAEAEHGNRSLPELIGHLGMLLVNFPNLNGVLGIKGEVDRNGNKLNALILVEWRDRARPPRVTRLVDFGPDDYSLEKRNNTNGALELPLPPAGTAARGGEHGVGVASPLPAWTRFKNGKDGDSPAIIQISPALVFAGAHSTGDNSAVIDIPESALDVEINLAKLVSIYGN